MNRSIPAMLLVVLALLVPAAAAQPTLPAPPPLPTVRECSTFQVDWANCEGYYLCVEAEWRGVERGACVADPCPDFTCSTCGDLDCYLPHAYACIWDGNKFVPECEDGSLACVQASFDRFTTVPVCVERPVCGPSDCVVDECSEFQIDWDYCPGYLICVSAGYGNVQVRETCVENPCSPRLGGCLACDVSCVPQTECHERVGTTSGSVGCTGVFGPYDYYCLTSCPPSITLVDCEQSVRGGARCYFPRF